eukprot:757950-Hanusia_phi.AAC.1
MEDAFHIVGVPHSQHKNLVAAKFGLAWISSDDVRGKSIMSREGSMLLPSNIRASPPASLLRAYSLLNPTLYPAHLLPSSPVPLPSSLLPLSAPPLSWSPGLLDFCPLLPSCICPFLFYLPLLLSSSSGLQSYPPRFVFSSPRSFLPLLPASSPRLLVSSSPPSSPFLPFLLRLLCTFCCNSKVSAETSKFQTLNSLSYKHARDPFKRSCREDWG